MYLIAVTAPEVAGILAAAAALGGVLLALIKLGGERDTLTITRAQGATTILDAALKSLNAELERKDDIIEDQERAFVALRQHAEHLAEELARCRADLERCNAPHD